MFWLKTDIDSLMILYTYVFINFLSVHEVNRNLTSKFKLSLSPVTNKIKVQVNLSAVCLHIWISRRFPWEGFVLIFIFHWFTFKFKLNFTAARHHSSLHLSTWFVLIKWQNFECQLPYQRLYPDTQHGLYWKQPCNLGKNAKLISA